MDGLNSVYYLIFRIMDEIVTLIFISNITMISCEGMRDRIHQSKVVYQMYRKWSCEKFAFGLIRKGSKQVRESEIVHLNFNIVSSHIKVKFLNIIFDGKSFLLVVW